MATLFRSGPGHLLIGNPTEAPVQRDSEASTPVAGAGMQYCGPTESISFDANVQMTGVQTAFTGDAYDADGVYSLPPNPSLSVELYDNTLDTLVNFFLGSNFNAGDEAIGLGGEIKLISLPTVVIVPESQKADGVNAKSAIWLPAAMIENVSGMTHGRLTSGSNAAQAYSVQFRAAKRAQDQTSPEPVAIPADAQFGFIGAPSAFSLTWQLPTIN